MVPKLTAVRTERTIHAEGGDQGKETTALTPQEHEIKHLREKLKSETEHRKNVELILRDVLDSHSWKITAPLRFAQKIRRNLFPLFKRKTHSISLNPVRHLRTLESGAHEVTGATPEFQLLSNRGHIPSGSLLVQARTKATSPMHYLLYYSSDGAFAGDKRVWLTLDEQAQLISIPNDTTHLRLDPFNAHSEFSILDFTITEIGTLQAVSRKAAAYLLPLLRNPAAFKNKAQKAWAIYKEGGLTALRARLLKQEPSVAYDEWVQKYDTIHDADRRKIKARIENFSLTPTISILLPTYNTPSRWLRLCLDSVCAQLYPHWELCIADDASTDPSVQKIIEEYAAKDSRIKFTIRDTNGHISAASQSALELAKGDYIALLDHDDELTQDALYQLAEEINRSPDAELIYSDEDKKLEDGRRFNPHFKSDWNYDLLLQQNYICHLVAFKTNTARSVGGFREGYDGAQDWDLILRVIDSVPESTIRHIPHILYHWRVIQSSTASSTSAKPYVLEAQKKAVSDHLRRRETTAQVTIREDISNLRVRFLPTSSPLVSLIMPTRDQIHVLKRAVESILTQTTYKNFELIIVDNGSIETETKHFLKSAASFSNVRVIQDLSPFNFSRLNNEAAQSATGALIGFINNDIEVISEDWLTELVANASRPEIAGAGAKLLYPNNHVQHAGIITGIGGIAGHNHKGRPVHDPGYFNRIILNQNLSALTAACLILKRSVFDEVLGFDETLSVAFNDVDLCLRIRSKGYKLTYCASAELYHYESISRGYETTPEKFARFEQEVERMKERWGSVLVNDPYYNPNLTLLTEDFSIAYPPRSKKPWRDV